LPARSKRRAARCGSESHQTSGIDVIGETLRESEGLKRRVDAVARAADKSPHGFMLEAIERRTGRDGEYTGFEDHR
jgi:pyruvate dehydrogenase complex dehydrogenase (E1) component